MNIFKKKEEYNPDILSLLKELLKSLKNEEIDQEKINNIANKYKLEVDFDLEIIRQNLLPRPKNKIPMPKSVIKNK